MKKLLFLILLVSCGSKETDENKVEQSFEELSNVEIPSPQLIEIDSVNLKDSLAKGNKSLLAVNVIHDDTLGYGYDILNDGKLYIHQPIIPAISGKQGFKTEADAKRVGEYVKNKIDNGIMPPTLTVDELKKLGVVKHIKF